MRFKSLNQKGFSLLEVLIALSVLSLIMLSTILFTESTQNTASRVVTEDEEMLQIETAMSRMEWDISQIYSPLYFSQIINPSSMTPDEGEVYNQLISYYQNNNRFNNISFEGIPIPLIQNPDKQTFTFFTSSNRRKVKNSKQTSYAWIKYSLEKDERRESDSEEDKIENKLIRQVVTNNVFSSMEIDWSDVKSQTLLRKISKLSFEFWDDKAQKWRDGLDTIKNGYYLIRAVRVTIDYFDQNNNPTTTQRIFRPLFPKFEAEDMYKFLNKKVNATTQTNTTTSESESTQNNSSGGQSE